jgi:hypothetical protein
MQKPRFMAKAMLYAKAFCDAEALVDGLAG